MSKIVRISITLPRDVLAAADARAKRLDRSRSWVVAEALRQISTDAPHAVREPATTYAAHDVEEARRRHLATDLRLPPEERLRRAEELGRLARSAQHRGPRQQIIAFDTYEDYYQWKKIRRIGG